MVERGEAAMVYVFGITGFILGFAGGLFAISMFLRHYPKSRLLQDRSLRWTYGLAVWILAGLCAALGVWLYERSIFLGG